MALGGKIRVLVVDDSLLIREVISDILGADPSFEVVGTAHNGKSAIEKVLALKPDAMTLDVEMPVMDGIECLRAVMKEHPLPVLMVSSITYEGGFKTLQALEAGAFDYIQKPKAQASSSLARVGQELKAKLKAAVQSAYWKSKAPARSASAAPPVDTATVLTTHPPKLQRTSSLQDHIIAVGISTGGPPCVTKIFETLPKNSPPVLVVQHMPEGFTKAMAERIDKVSALKVTEAKDGDLVLSGHGYIAPGNYHMRLVRESGQLKLRLNRAEPVSGHRPSVDVMFESVAEVCGAKAIGVIMTGMGRDGVTSLKKMRGLGAHTIAQDEASSVVFGMPKIAIQEQAVDEVLSLDGIVLRLQRIASGK